MSIETIGSPSELKSPFFLENLETCQKWQKYINQKDGKIKAKCTPWALKLKGEIVNDETWSFSVDKATMSNGSLFLSSKKNIYKKTIISAVNIDLAHSFNIKRKTALGSFKNVFGQKFVLF